MPDDAIRVNGEALTIGGEYVTINGANMPELADSGEEIAAALATFFNTTSEVVVIDGNGDMGTEAPTSLTTPTNTGIASGNAGMIPTGAQYIGANAPNVLNSTANGVASGVLTISGANGLHQIIAIDESITSVAAPTNLVQGQVITLKCVAWPGNSSVNFTTDHATDWNADWDIGNSSDWPSDPQALAPGDQIIFVVHVGEGGRPTVKFDRVVTPTDEELTSSGAITAGVAWTQLNHTTTPIAATIADLAAHFGLYIIENTSASGTAAHTVTLSAGTFNGTNDVATLNAPGEALVLLVQQDGTASVAENIGSVGLSTA